MPIQLKPKEAVEDSEYSKKIGINQGIREYNVPPEALSKYTSVGLAGLTPLPIGQTFICDFLGWSIYVPTEVCAVQNTLEHLPECVLHWLYNVMHGDGDVERRLKLSMDMIDRDLKMLEKAPISAIAEAYSAELKTERQRRENAIDFYRWWLTEKDTPIGEAYNTELVKIMKQRRSAGEVGNCEVNAE